MEQAAIIGIDISQKSLRLHEATAEGDPVFRKTLSRGRLGEHRKVGQLSSHAGSRSCFHAKSCDAAMTQTCHHRPNSATAPHFSDMCVQH